MTTPDKEVMPIDRTAGPWTTDGRYIRASERGIVSDVIAIVDGWGRMTNEANAQFIVTACNAYEPMREALAATTVEVERDLADFLSSVCVVRDEGPDRSTLDPEDAEEVARLECIIWRARTALSTLPVNERPHSGSDNERNFENVRDAWKIIWEREAEIARLSRSLSELEAHHVEQNRLKRRSEADSKTLRIIRAALYGTDRQTSADVERLREALKSLTANVGRLRDVLGDDTMMSSWREARAALKGMPKPASEAGNLSTDEVAK
jgi:hypothetical protein